MGHTSCLLFFFFFSSSSILQAFKSDAAFLLCDAPLLLYLVLLLSSCLPSCFFSPHTRPPFLLLLLLQYLYDLPAPEGSTAPQYLHCEQLWQSLECCAGSSSPRAGAEYCGYFRRNSWAYINILPPKFTSPRLMFHHFLSNYFKSGYFS